MANTTKKNTGPATDLLTTGDLAIRAELSRETIIGLIRTGRIPALRTERGHFLITLVDAQRFLVGRSRT